MDSGEDFGAFHRRTFGYVWSTLGRAGIQREAERCELAQEVYLVAHQKRGTRDPAAPELAWLGRIARNMAWRFRALARSRKEHLLDELDDVEPIAGALDAEALVIGRAQYLAVMEALDEDQREVFEMHEVEGFGLAEIAATLRKPIGTVSTILRRARADVDAAAARLKAREAHAGRAMVLAPLGLGSWREAGGWFDGAPQGMEEQVFRAVRLRIARAATVGVAASVGASAAGKGLVFGSGIVVGGGATAAAFVLGLLGAAPAPSPSIARAPEQAAALASAVAPGTSAVPAAVVVATASPTSSTSLPTPRVVAAIDLDEERLVSRAESALARGNTDAARGALDEHAKRFPRGALKAERDRLRARLGTGAPDAGRAPNRLMDAEQ